MAFILSLETATTMCSVALGKDGKVIAFKERNEGFTHSENLTLFIQEVLADAKVELKQLDAIAVSKGPGSYTGLRIGVSTAKGLCYGLERPLISISTLYSMFNEMKRQTTNDKPQTLFCPMLDARRMEVYCAVYDMQGNVVKEISADIINENSFAELLNENKIIFFGDGAAKCKEAMSYHDHAIFVDNIFPSAKAMVTLAEEKFSKKDFEDVAYFEPFYLKDFVGTTKK